LLNSSFASFFLYGFALFISGANRLPDANSPAEADTVSCLCAVVLLMVGRLNETTNKQFLAFILLVI
jgi:hypothetical protein